MMDRTAASLLIRMHIALKQLGQEPDFPQQQDELVLEEAVKVAQGNPRELFDEHALWEAGLRSDDEHVPDCSDGDHGQLSS